MSAPLDNTSDEVDVLEGATIERAWIQEPMDAWSFPVVRLRIRFRDSLRVNDSAVGEYELWQDGEGNGPGYLALVSDS